MTLTFQTRPRLQSQRQLNHSIADTKRKLLTASLLIQVFLVSLR